jgi:major membrane immunogen (membrane-anchored lipoprotein)
MTRWPLGRLAAGMLTGAFSALVLTGCTADPRPLQDGVYTGQSAPDEQGAVGQATVTVRAGGIVDCVFATVQADGSTKDEDYGKDFDGTIGHEEYYAEAQAAVAAFDVYAQQLIEVGDPDEVDVISGATIAHEQFRAAVEEALDQSREAGATPR